MRVGPFVMFEPCHTVLVQWRRCVTVLLLGVLCAVAGCSMGGIGEAGPEGAGHTHAAGDAAVSMLVGDGTRDDEVGYRLADVALPEAAGEFGRVSFRIERFDGSTVRDYLVEQTKKLHLYVVRTDLAVFRHLHPTMAPDGTWSAPLTLSEPGEYRVLTEFVARDEGGNGDFIMLGTRNRVPGPWRPEPVPTSRTGDDGTVTVAARGTVAVGTDGRLELQVRDAARRPVELGSYLGTFAHLTGFHIESGSAVHLHPMGEPQVDDAATRLSFHTEFEKPGSYRLFAQVRVDGYLHTVPVTVEVKGRGPGS
jgi:hypothetical protein